MGSIASTFFIRCRHAKCFLIPPFSAVAGSLTRLAAAHNIKIIYSMLMQKAVLTMTRLAYDGLLVAMMLLQQRVSAASCVRRVFITAAFSLTSIALIPDLPAALVAGFWPFPSGVA